MDFYRIGRIGKPHGIHGEVQIWIDDDVFDRIHSPYVFIEVDGLPVPFFFTEYRFRGEQSVLALFDGIDSEEKARRLTGCSVLFERDKVPADGGEASCSLHALVGFAVEDTRTHTTVGIIRHVNDTTINTLFEVETSDEDLIYIPVAEEWIEDIDPRRRTISMNLPEGLLDINTL